MIALRQRHQPRRVQRPVNQIQVVRGQPQRLEQRLAHKLRALVIDLQPHGVAFAAVVQLVLDRLEQVAGLLLVDVKLAVARHAERPVAQQFVPGKQIRQVMPDQPAQIDVILPRIGPRQLDHARQDARDLHHRHVLEHFPVPGHLQPHDEVQRLVEQLRERMRRVNRQRRQHRADLRVVIILHPGQVRRVQFRQLQQADAVGRQRRASAPRASRRIAAPPCAAPA